MAAGEVKTYSGDEVTFVFANIPAQGLGPDEFLTVEDNADAFTDEQGVDGETARAKTRDFRGTVKLTLLQTSSMNAQLSALHNADKRTPGGVGIAPLFVRDRSGFSIHKADKAWITKCDPRSYARGIRMRVWTFRCAELDSFEGGN